MNICKWIQGVRCAKAENRAHDKACRTLAVAGSVALSASCCASCNLAISPSSSTDRVHGSIATVRTICSACSAIVNRSITTCCASVNGYACKHGQSRVDKSQATHDKPRILPNDVRPKVITRSCQIISI